MVGRLKRALRALPGLACGVCIGVAWLAAQQDNWQRMWLAVAAAYLFLCVTVIDFIVPRRPRGAARTGGSNGKG
jgi:membrane protein YdbS with pleckstrin-like domain